MFSTGSIALSSGSLVRAFEEDFHLYHVMLAGYASITRIPAGLVLGDAKQSFLHSRTRTSGRNSNVGIMINVVSV